MRLSDTPVRLTSFWPLLLVVALLATWVWRLSPQNLAIVPYKLLIVCLAMYLSHRFDERAFAGRAYTERSEIARAIVYGATVIAMSVAL